MYADIEKNKRRSTFLIAAFIGLVVAIGWIYGYLVSDTGPFGLGIAVAISLGMTAVSWFASDSVALSLSGAQELERREDFPTLWNVVENLAITAGLPKPRIYLIEDPSPNAFATGRDPKHASVAVTTGLLQRLEKAELEAVLAHELSHIGNYDTRVMTLAVVLVGAIGILADVGLRFSGRRGSDHEGGGNILAVVGFVLILLSPLIANLMKLAISRHREYLADASGALLTRYPEGLARALEKIRDAALPVERTSVATNHLWISDPEGGERLGEKVASLFSTHPPINERIARLRQMGR